jgi:hypothetical protein
MKVRVPHGFALDASEIKVDANNPHPIWPRVADAIRGTRAVVLDVTQDEALELWTEADYRRECLDAIEYRGLRNSAIAMLKNLKEAGFRK